jgi:hypothetical protein
MVIEPLTRGKAQNGFALITAFDPKSILTGRGSRWAYRVAVSLIAINLTGDIANTMLGTEPRAIVGVLSLSEY